jgi:serine/threonine-protein kinase HipA
MQAEILIDAKVVGVLAHDSTSGLFSFEYDTSWQADSQAYALSPTLPLTKSSASAEIHSAHVRQFFENLLPEGQALDNASSAFQVSKSNVMGLLLALGKETAGAISIRALGASNTVADSVLRLITNQELSARIKNRPEEPFEVWDGRIRLSIAGYQDKIAVFKQGNDLFLVDGPPYASTRILKPEPVRETLRSLTSNEFFCMRLADQLKIPTSRVELVHVPEPVLLVTRFDRLEQTGKIKRIHVIDGCQALGLSSAFKYERPYGDSRDVKHVRSGASFSMLAKLIDQLSATPAAQRILLLKWAILQVLIGNTDAHAKNISFYCGSEGLAIAPAYDLTCSLVFKDRGLDDHLAMAIGDAFRIEDITPFEWAHFAQQCGIPKRLVARTLKDMSMMMMNAVTPVMNACVAEGADMCHLTTISELILRESARQLAMADDIIEVSDHWLNDRS